MSPPFFSLRSPLPTSLSNSPLFHPHPPSKPPSSHFHYFIHVHEAPMHTATSIIPPCLHTHPTPFIPHTPSYSCSPFSQPCPSPWTTSTSSPSFTRSSAPPTSTPPPRPMSTGIIGAVTGKLSSHQCLPRSVPSPKIWSAAESTTTTRRKETKILSTNTSIGSSRGTSNQTKFSPKITTTNTHSSTKKRVTFRFSFFHFFSSSSGFRCR